VPNKLADQRLRGDREEQVVEEGGVSAGVEDTPGLGGVVPAFQQALGGEGA
jgi:hypothetical protein